MNENGSSSESLPLPFVKYFSGDVDGAFQTTDTTTTDRTADSNNVNNIKTWATPYALCRHCFVNVAVAVKFW